MGTKTAAALATIGFASFVVAFVMIAGCRRDDAPSRGEGPTDAFEIDSWQIVRMGGEPAGYERLQVTPETHDGQTVLRVQMTSRMRMKRFGDELDITITIRSLETLDGQLLEFSSSQPLGSVATEVHGKVVGDVLKLQTEAAGTVRTNEIPWKPEYTGPSGPTLSLLRSPMRPGETRLVESYDVMFGQVVATTLKAREFESVETPDGQRKLLRIDTSTTVQNMPIAGVTWTDADGHGVKMEMEAMNMESVEATGEEAMAAIGESQLDFGLDNLVRVNTRLENPHETRQARYRVHLDGGDPTEVFSQGISQRVEAVDENTAEITVYALRPGSSLGNNAVGDDPAGSEYLKSNSLIQSQDGAVTAMARSVAPDETDPWRTAVAMEAHVCGLMAKGEYSTAFASAAEVAKDPSGDCTEHAVLLAALARARGIPARVAMGLVYFDQAFAYHMWTEVFVEGRWIPLDATLGIGGIGAAHIKVADSSLKGSGPYAAFLPVLKILGQLQIEILDPPEVR